MTKTKTKIGEYHIQQVFSAVHMVYRLINSTYNTRELVLRLTRLVSQLLKSSSCSLYLLDETKTKISVIAFYKNGIHRCLDKKKDMKDVSEEIFDVALGGSVFKKREIGLPLVADDNVGAIFIARKKNEPTYIDFDRRLLAVLAEQIVTAVKNLQLSEAQQQVILGSIKSIGKLLKKQSAGTIAHTPVYFQVTKMLAEKLNMGEEQIRCLRYASMLHDAGSIDISYEILAKKSRLTPEEFKLIRDIPAKSVEFIKPFSFLKPVLPIVLYHHEKYDGTGYPSGLKKEQIPLGARVMAVVTAFEAMVRSRPYRHSLSIDQALEELKQNSAIQFDPKIVKAFCQLAEQKKFRKYLRLLKR